MEETEKRRGQVFANCCKGRGKEKLDNDLLFEARNRGGMEHGLAGGKGDQSGRRKGKFEGESISDHCHKTGKPKKGVDWIIILLLRGQNFVPRY